MGNCYVRAHGQIPGLKSSTQARAVIEENGLHAEARRINNDPVPLFPSLRRVRNKPFERSLKFFLRQDSHIPQRLQFFQLG